MKYNHKPNQKIRAMKLKYVLVAKNFVMNNMIKKKNNLAIYYQIRMM